MKRFLSAALALCTIVYPIPIAARQSSAVSITAMSRASVKPFQRLTITGSGFQPATSAISVVFNPKQRGVKISVPAYAATSTQVDVIVPPIPDPQNKGFAFGAVDVQVIQISSDTVSSSNVLTTLDLAPMTAVPGSLKPGALTRGFARVLQTLLTSAKSGPRVNAATQAAIDTYLQSQSEVLAKIDRIVADPTYATTLNTGDNSQVVLDVQALKFSDQMLLGYLEGVSTFSASREGFAHSAALPSCEPDTGDLDANGWLCSFFRSVASESTKWAGWGMVTAGAVVGVGAFMFEVPLIALTAGIVAIGLSVVAANYLVGSYILGTTAGSTETVSVSETMRDQGKKILDTAREYTSGIPVVANTAMDLFATNAAAAEIPSEGPRGGTALTLPGRDPSGGGSTVTVFRGAGATATTERVTVPAAASTKPIAEVRLPAPAASVFDGAYSGTVTWYAFDGEDSLSGTLGLALSVAGGRITVSAPVGGSGAVGVNGAAGGSASGLGFSCGFSGGLVASAATGPASGSGTFGCSSPDGRAWGGWSVARR